MESFVDEKLVDDADMEVIMDKLNSRPRKTLGYSTPRDISSKQPAVNSAVKVDRFTHNY